MAVTLDHWARSQTAYLSPSSGSPYVWAAARPWFGRLTRALVRLFGFQRFVRVRYAAARTEDPWSWHREAREHASAALAQRHTCATPLHSVSHNPTC